MITQAWSRIVPTREVSREVLGGAIRSAQKVGFLRNMPDASRLIENP
jgi:NitT/TauT family transport system substrate-binding protein